MNLISFFCYVLPFYLTPDYFSLKKHLWSGVRHSESVDLLICDVKAVSARNKKVGQLAIRVMVLTFRLRRKQIPELVRPFSDRVHIIELMVPEPLVEAVIDCPAAIIRYVVPSNVVEAHNAVFPPL